MNEEKTCFIECIQVFTLRFEDSAGSRGHWKEGGGNGEGAKIQQYQLQSHKQEMLI